jgi:hypothetical protein
MMTDVGLNLIRGFLNGDSPSPPSHMAVGTGTSGEQASDTAMESEVLRNAITKEHSDTAGVIDYKMILASTDANGNAISELGLLNAASGGDLVIRITHLPYNKTSSFAVKYRIRQTLQSI